MFREALLLVHPTFGVLGAMAALWVLVEVIRVDVDGLWRMKTASVFVAGLLFATWLAGGLWDMAYFDADREFVDKGSWAFYGTMGMHMKDHLFPIILVLALYLPIAVFRGNLVANRGNRIIVGIVSCLVVLSALAMEGAGATLGLSVKVGLMHTGGM